MDDNLNCDFCNNIETAHFFIECGSYGIDEPTKCCTNRECIDKAMILMLDEADSVNNELAE